MDALIKSYFDELESRNKETQYEAYKNLLAATEQEVNWAYEVWDQLLEGLTDRDPHTRSRSAQFLSRLAISDPENRMLNDFPAVWEVTKDEKFVTARHSLQSIWRVGLAGEQQRELVVKHFEARFHSCADEKNHTLIRFDIIQGLRSLYDAVNDEKIKNAALTLISGEEDEKYRKKYTSQWRNT
jgi:hypothetical protein